MKIAYFDCFSGISGDICVGALLDAGADFETLQAGLHGLGVHGFSLRAEKVSKHGIAATQFNVCIDQHHDHAHAHGHDHGHGHHEHHHRNLHHITHLIQDAPLPDAVKKGAIATFQRLGEAEAKVHNTTIDKIHFHEVGAIDSIVDIVASHYALHLLGVEKVFCSPLPTGSGTVRCDHGLMPVPAPATAELLAGRPTHAGDCAGEMTTPTGAALMVTLTDEFCSAPPMKTASIGYGAGTREYPDRANVSRVFIGEWSARSASDTITVLETNIDDMNPELLPEIIAELMRAGARDAFVAPVSGKKGRTAFLITVLCDEANHAELARLLLVHTSTFGVRIRQEKRLILDREHRTVETPWGAVPVKIGLLDGVAVSRSPEFESCRAAAQAAGVPVKQVYEAALAAAVRGEFTHA